MLFLQIENVNNIKEAKDSEFGFNNNAGVIRNENRQVVGFYTLNKLNNTEIELQELEIVFEYQGCGYGTMFIKQLFNDYSELKKISGKTLLESKGFYETLGAKFKGKYFTIHKNNLK